VQSAVIIDVIVDVNTGIKNGIYPPNILYPGVVQIYLRIEKFVGMYLIP